MSISGVKVTLVSLGSGKSPDQIAYFFQIANVTGIRNDWDNNPISNYLKLMSVFEEGQDLSGFQFTDVQDQFCFVPRSVGIFAERFDAGYYPQLEV